VIKKQSHHATIYSISRVRDNFPYSTAGEAGHILGLGGPHAARGPYVVHPSATTIDIAGIKNYKI